MKRTIILSLLACQSLFAAIYDSDTQTVSNDLFVMKFQDTSSWDTSKVLMNELVSISSACIDYWEGLLKDNYSLSANNRITFTLNFKAESGTHLGVATTYSSVNTKYTSGLANDAYYGYTNASNGVKYNTIATSVNKLFNNQLYSSSSNDFEITMNSNYDFYYGAETSFTNYDFHSILLHEMTHGMGFSSSVFRGTDSFALNELEASSGTALVDINGNAIYEISLYDTLILENLDDHDPTQLTLGSTVSLGDSGLTIYNPSEYKSGSSFSHIDEASDPDALMNFSIAKGVVKRELSALELDLYQQMGFEIAATIPEPSSAFFILTLLPVMASRRRRAA